MAVSRLMLPVLVLSALTISSTVAQFGPNYWNGNIDKCSMQYHLCSRQNNPHCNVTFEASSSNEFNSTCRTMVHCRFNNAFLKTGHGGTCFLLHKGLPNPRYPGINHDTYQHSFTLELFGRAANSLFKGNFKTVATKAVPIIDGKIKQFNKELASIRIVNEYTCSIMSSCIPSN